MSKPKSSTKPTTEILSSKNEEHVFWEVGLKKLEKEWLPFVYAVDEEGEAATLPIDELQEFAQAAMIACNTARQRNIDESLKGQTTEKAPPVQPSPAALAERSKKAKQKQVLVPNVA